MFGKTRSFLAALLAGAAFAQPQLPRISSGPPTITARKGKRTGSKPRTFLSLVRGGNSRPALSGCGAAECDRRRRQIARGTLKPQSRGI